MDQAATGVTPPVAPLAGPTVSIVLPCYNVEPFLDQCLESLVGQSYPRIQLIVVNDGSTDGTLAIARRYEAAHDGVTVIDQVNAGLGSARNVGAELARGEYLMFVDSDDYLSLDAIEKLVTLAEETEADIVIGGRRRFNSRKTWERKSLFRSGTVRGVTARKFPRVFQLHAVHGKLMRMAFVQEHHIAFPELRAWESTAYAYITYARARRISVTQDVVYYWRQREGGEPSIMQSPLKPSSLLCRFATIETTLALHRNARGKATTRFKKPYGKEFGQRLLGGHINAFVYLPDGPRAEEAIDLLARFTSQYEDKIRATCKASAVRIYEAIWSRDAAELRRALKGKPAEQAKDDDDDDDDDDANDDG